MKWQVALHVIMWTSLGQVAWLVLTALAVLAWQHDDIQLDPDDSWW